MEKTQKKHWYQFYTTVCPVCGSEDTIKERRYTNRPKEFWDRHEYTEVFDYCNI